MAVLSSPAQLRQKVRHLQPYSAGFFGWQISWPGLVDQPSQSWSVARTVLKGYLQDFEGPDKHSVLGII